jgi:phosphoenolpyruvate-protein kinase (PTS system EI component)
MEGSAIVEGIAVGRAVVWASDPPPRVVVGTAKQEHLRLKFAIACATNGVEELVRLLPRAEAELFEPELAILSELEPVLLSQVDAGMRAEDAVNEATSLLSSDLLVDARARLLDGLAYGERTVESLLEGRDGDRVLVASTLTPSVVASLPARVVGILAASGEAASPGGTSHAVILARARDIPLVLVGPENVMEVRDDETVALDATSGPAMVWVAPDEATLAQVRLRREQWGRARVEEEASVAAPLDHLGLRVCVNVSSLREHIPVAAEGIGLVRTELIFSKRAHAPSEAEQLGAIRAIASRVGNVPIVVRLFDAGGDKPLPWLPPPAGSSMRGIELLLMHPTVLEAQLRAVTRAAECGDIQALLPLVRSAQDLAQVRALAGGKIPIGALVETPEAVERIDEIASTADFVSIGTNDLLALVTGLGRMNSALSVDPRVLRMIESVVKVAHAHGRQVSVCGEMAGDPHSARILVGLGVDALSTATGHFARVKRALRDVSLHDCLEMASAALK